jgi:hypothetical protein
MDARAGNRHVVWRIVAAGVALEAGAAIAVGVRELRAHDTPAAPAVSAPAATYPNLTDRYPELATADASLVRGLATYHSWPGPGSERLEAGLRPLGDRGRFCLLRSILERDDGRRTEVTPTSTSTMSVTLTWGPEGDDDVSAASYFRKHPDAVSDAVLARAVRDKALPFASRYLAIVAVARPGSAAGAQALAGLALDASAPTALRTAALLRIPTCGIAPPELRKLLWEPWDDLDTVTALALAACGDLAAPSVVRSELARVATVRDVTDEPMARVCAVAAARAPRASEALLAAARGIPALLEAARTTPPDRRKECADAFAALSAEFDRWLSSNPEVADTSFERRRSAYLASDRRKRELALDSFESIAACPEASLDFGAAAIALADPDKRDEWLLRLDAVAASVEEDVARAATPREKLDVLLRLLPAETTTNDIAAHPTSLPFLLSSRRGDCLGWTSLCVALGERLGLPLRGVLVPRHAFVRWDDGTTRINVDPANRGVTRSDEDYAREFTEPDGSAPDLRSVSGRALLAEVCSNFACRAINTWFREEGVLWARRALALDPECDNAPFNLAAAIVRVPDAPPDEVRAALAARAASRRFRASPSVAYDLLLGGDPDGALRVLRRCEPSAAAACMRATALLAKGDLATARRELTAIGDGEESKAARDALDLALRWCTDHTTMFPASMDADAHLDVAELLLLVPDDRVPAAEQVVSLLDRDRARFRERIDFQRSSIRCRDEVLLPGWVVARRWYEARIRAARILGDDAGAEALRKFVFDPPKR